MATKEDKMKSLIYRLKDYLGNGKYLYEVKAFLEDDLQCTKGEIMEIMRKVESNGIVYDGTKLVAKGDNHGVY